jgi:hypothetical protein
VYGGGGIRGTVHRIRTPLVGILATAIALAGACSPATAAAAFREVAPAVSLRASFTPERLGKPTTIAFGFQITTPAGRVPSPLIDVGLLYPENLGVATSGLGLESCSLARLEAYGPEGCPVNSHMGYGAAVAEVPFGPGIIHERAGLTLLAGPVENGHLGLLFYAQGAVPIAAQLVFPGLILPAPIPFGGNLDTSLPLVPSVPGAPYVAIVSLHTTIGPSHITYYERIHGRLTAFRPKGIVLPHHCPPGGFPFTAELHFLNGTSAFAHTVVPCPGHDGHGR